MAFNLNLGQMNYLQSLRKEVFKTVVSEESACSGPLLPSSGNAGVTQSTSVRFCKNSPETEKLISCVCRRALMVELLRFVYC